MLFKGYKVGTPSAATILLCFFLPWVLISCGPQPIGSFSGYELAIGAEIQSGFGARQMEPQGLLCLAPMAAALTLLLAFFASRRQQAKKRDKVGLFLVGLLPLALLLLMGTSARTDLAEQNVLLQFQFGAFGTLLGLMGILVASIMNFSKGEATEASASPEDVVDLDSLDDSGEGAEPLSVT